MCKSILKGQNVPGTDGTYHGTDGDVSPGQTGRTPGGVPPKFFMFIGFFFPQTTTQLKEARKGNGPPYKGNGWPFQLSKMPLIATVPLAALVVGARADLLRNGQNTGPQLA